MSATAFVLLRIFCLSIADAVKTFINKNFVSNFSTLSLLLRTTIYNLLNLRAFILLKNILSCFFMSIYRLLYFLYMLTKKQNPALKSTICNFLIAYINVTFSEIRITKNGGLCCFFCGFQGTNVRLRTNVSFLHKVPSLHNCP